MLTKIQLYAASVTILLKIAFLYYLHWSVSGLLLANFLGLMIISVYGLMLYLQKMPSLNIDILYHKNNIISYLRRGLPFIPSLIFARILASADQWILARYSDLHNVGMYAFADAFGQLYHLFIIYPLMGAYFPHLIKKFIANKNKCAEIEAENKKHMWISMIGITILIIAGYVLGKPILMWLTPTKYHASLPYIVPLLLGQVLLMGTYFIACYLQYLKKIHLLVGLITIPALSNVILNILFIPYFHINGCIAATLLSYLLYFYLTLWWNKKLLKQHPNKNSPALNN